MIIRIPVRVALSARWLPGPVTIAGTTGNLSTQQGPYRVRLYERAGGRLMREGWSDAAGNYAFAGIAAGQTWFVVMHDHSPDANAPTFYNAVIQDMVST